jgi:hypothetical protein
MPTLTTQRIIISEIQDRIRLVKNAGGVLYLDARKATGYGLPTNSPLTSPWVDLSGNGNNATPNNMAGTTASGVDTTNPLKPFWATDGIDDFWSLVNTASLDITVAPLAIFSTIKISTGAAGGYVINKNNSGADFQYALNWDNVGSRMVCYLEGANRKTGTSSSVVANSWYNVGWIWDGSTVKLFVNLIQDGAAGTYSGSLTSRPNLRIGRRETAAGHLKCSIATVTIYYGNKVIVPNVLAAERVISKNYIS